MDRGAWWATFHGVTKSWNHLGTEQQPTVAFLYFKEEVAVDAQQRSDLQDSN